jgi:hypothetical protein
MEVQKIMYVGIKKRKATVPHVQLIDNFVDIAITAAVYAVDAVEGVDNDIGIVVDVLTDVVIAAVDAVDTIGTVEAVHGGIAVVVFDEVGDAIDAIDAVAGIDGSVVAGLDNRKQ